MKDFFTPKRIKTSVNDNPTWMQRVDFTNASPENLAETTFRDDAWRLAMRQKARTIDINGNPHSLYIKNPDGTYSYDFNYVDRVRTTMGVPPLKKEVLPLIPNDGIYKEGLNDPNRIHPNQIILKEPFRIHDKWDLQFLKDERASLFPAFSRWLTQHPNNITNYVRNIDALEAVGGNPFILDMQVSPNTILTRKVNTK